MKFYVGLFLCFFTYLSNGQKIIYSEPDREDIREMRYEIIGKMNSHFLIYKGGKTQHYINVFDANMQLLQKKYLNVYSDNERILNIDFTNYSSYAWAFYQYQKKRTIYNMAQKIDVEGNIVEDPIVLDTTDSRDVQDNKVYSFFQSADKSKILFLKVNSYEEKLHKVSTFLYDENLTLLSKGYEEVAMKERNSFFNRV
jgi:hypothetical protein